MATVQSRTKETMATRPPYAKKRGVVTTKTGENNLAVTQGAKAKKFVGLKDSAKVRKVFDEETNTFRGIRNQGEAILPKNGKPVVVVKPTVRTRPVETKENIDVKEESRKSKIPTRGKPVTKKPSKFVNEVSAVPQLTFTKFVTAILPEGVTDVDSLGNHLFCRDYANDVINYARSVEEQLRIPENYVEKCPVKTSSRGVLTDWLIQVQNHLHMDEETLHLTVAMIDHFLSRRPLALAKIQLLGITCLLIAAKYNERFPPSIDKLLHLTDNSYLYEEVIQMELLTLKVLGFALYIPTPRIFLERGLQAVPFYDKKLEFLSSYLLDLSLPDFKILQFAPSLRAAAAIYLSRRVLETEADDRCDGEARVDDSWIKSLEYYLGYKEQDIKECASRFARLLSRADANKLQGARAKYEHSRYGGISKLFTWSSNPVILDLANSGQTEPQETAV